VAVIDEMIALARRVVACEGWRWMPGMRTLNAMRVVHDPDLWPDRPCALREGCWIDTAPPRPLNDDLPDLTDPATMGCLLALVREAWGGDFEQVWSEWYPPLSRWGIRAGSRSVLLVSGDTEAEALVAALEAAP
jgi:hypothetical protein